MVKNSAVSFVLTALALVGWALMFMAGTDVWHDTGRLDLWRLEGPPYSDLRAFVLIFYGLLPVLVAQAVVAIRRLRLDRGSIRRSTAS